MKKLFLLSACALFFVTIASPLSTFGQNPSRSMDSLQLANFIDSIVMEYEIPGLAATAIGGIEVVWNGNFGCQNLEDSIPVDDSTVFACFSISKSLTATAVMQMAENGFCDIDADISNYFDFCVSNPNFPLNVISTRQALSHVSSIVDGNIFSNITMGDDSPIPLGFYLENYLVPGGTYYSDLNWNSTYSPGTYHSYSNVGIALAGYLVDTLSEYGFTEYCRDSIFIPLGMDQATWRISEIDSSHFAQWYQYSGAGYIHSDPIGVPWYPGGTMTASALELSNYAISMMNGGIFNGTRILEESSVEEMCTPQYPQTGSNYGLGIMNNTLGEREVVGHSGNFDFGKSRMYWCPDEYTGIVVLTNVNCSYSAMAQIMQALFDYAQENIVWPNVEEQKNDNDISMEVYPNPASDHINIILPEKQDISTIEIIDLNGRIVRIIQLNSSQATLDVSDLPSGMYIIQATASTEMITRKIMKY
jgi:CubicO group peptidase (beta-lactamase class C family)